MILQCLCACVRFCYWSWRFCIPPATGELRANQSLLKELPLNTAARWPGVNLQLLFSVCESKSARWVCTSVSGNIGQEPCPRCATFSHEIILLKAHVFIPKEGIITYGIEADTHKHRKLAARSAVTRYLEKTNFTQSPWPRQNAGENAADKQRTIQRSGRRFSPNLTQRSKSAVQNLFISLFVWLSSWPVCVYSTLALFLRFWSLFYFRAWPSPKSCLTFSRKVGERCAIEWLSKLCSGFIFRDVPFIKSGLSGSAFL